MLDDNELLFDELYEKTKDCGRVQFINLLMEKERENQELKEQLEVGKEQYNDLVEEKENLQEQLDYLRGGEYLNQLRFERDMLQHVVDTNGVPSEVYDYLDCTHRNTELLEESQELKKQLDELQTLYNNMFKCHCNRVQVETLLSQQKEFIEWLERRLFLLRDVASELALGMCSTDYQDAKIEVYQEILSKYKEIIGVKDE